jgi:hypothetical protein
MRSLAIQETQVLVLAAGDTPQAAANARGHLFERFVAKVLERFGYDEPRVEHLNVTDDGVELDIAVRHRLNNRPALAECKAYSAPVHVRELNAFYGKLTTRRFAEPDTDGFFFALPRLTQPGAEQARTIEGRDTHFRYLNADVVADVARQLGLISDPPSAVGTLIMSDPAIVVTEDGVYAARKVLDPDSRTAVEVIAWSNGVSVPVPTLELLRTSAFVSGVPVRDVRSSEPGRVVRTEADSPMIVEVRGSGSDFEYQLPASPKYFVGRSNVLEEIEQLVARGPGTLVINAQSGWGKSSLALRLKQSAAQAGGHGVVFDSRTAASRAYVAAALRAAALQAERVRVLSLAEDTSWASLPSALDTMKHARWNDKGAPLLIFFDQFENVFRDEALTREFRDLALGINDIGVPVVIGFAWKTDLVGWTERHPYQLRDEIRGQARVTNLPPLGAREIDTLLRRLERALGRNLLRDLKQRLREYSQGLPWLFKKLAGHVLREVQQGTTQAELVAEALNVQNLFQADLDELQPAEQEVLKVIARYAPVPVSEVMDRVPAELVQSLVDRRLVVKVGERLDTYWDIFRDFLTTGRVPIEDSYIVRSTPRMVARLLQTVMRAEGDMSVSDLATVLNTSENAVYNLSRELRLFGALAYAPNRVRLAEEIMTASDPEEELRRRVASSLRRHRAFSTFSRLAEQQGGAVSINALARNLPATFPAVEVAETTWGRYARSFARWFQYAGLARSGIRTSNQRTKLPPRSKGF